VRGRPWHRRGTRGGTDRRSPQPARAGQQGRCPRGDPDRRTGPRDRGRQDGHEQRLFQFK